ncbi:GntR family transcriptional regulator [Xinfangfangia sp. CPCC 101601]|uniref:GntR family transcriptional regulator n=1 Tax=Pseudogemmobacter lacusdianii TaxID=3069608 RepID=A0ABU0W2L4_9RHOB|nr:GntR family transcriptional regulator [Xinfangfangia sp. CPCC 101601]MDQ2068189.1 GntR family transcriptional regulator [Xinfangfangia sp. CPCC 101601]
MNQRDKLSNEVGKRGVPAVTVRRRLEDALRSAIVDGHFPPHYHLSDRELQETYNVSRTVVREAVRQLEAEGLVVTKPYRGTFVRQVTANEARQLYDLRAVLEAFAAQNFAVNASDNYMERLEAVIGKIRGQSGANDSRGLIELKQEFYRILLLGCGNDYLRKILTEILNNNRQLHRSTMLESERVGVMLCDLDALMAALRQRDGDAAWAAARLHVRNASEGAIRRLVEDEAAEAAMTKPLR